MLIKDDLFGNSLWKIHTDSGIYAARIMKCESRYTHEKRTREINEVLTRLSNLDINLPVIEESISGKYVLKYKGIYIIFSRWINGNKFDEHDDLLIGSAGRLLASMHKELKNWEMEFSDLAPFPVVPPIGGVLDLLVNDKNFEKNMGKLTELNIQIAMQLQTSSCSDLPSTIAGYSFRPGNLVTHWHSVTGLTGFMDLKRDVRMLDISTFILSFFDDIDPTCAFDEKQVEIGKASKFISSYRQVSKLPDDEIGFLPLIVSGLLFVRLSMFVSCIGFVEKINMEKVNEFIENELTHVYYWRDNGDMIVERLIEQVNE